MRKDQILIDVNCHECKKETTKTLKYIERREREGKTIFFCSRKCTDTHHAKLMTGENNPNFNGSWHGITMADLTHEERLARGRKISETMKSKGTGVGERNGRWAGGRQKVNCVMCDKETTVNPYVHRKILAGLQKPCCSHECVGAYGRSKIVTKRTSIEIKMADELASRQIEYIEQYNLGNKFALDFFLPEYQIVIECDGDYWHNLPDVKKRDKSKNAYIKACGFPLYRFWEHEINADIESCVDVVLAEINEMEAI